MTNPREEMQWLMQLIEGASRRDNEEMRHIIRSVYGALCFEAGMDKETALAEIAAHWDKVEALIARTRNRKFN